MNLYEKLALMASAAALTVLTALGAATDRATPETANPAEAQEMAQAQDIAEDKLDTVVLPPFAEESDDEVMEFLPPRPGFMRPAYAPDDENLTVSAPGSAESAETSGAAGTAGDSENPVTSRDPDVSHSPETSEPPVSTAAPETEELPEITPPPAAPEVTTTQPKPQPKPETADPRPAPVPETGDRLQTLIAVAESQIGVQESEPNNVKYNTWFYGREVRESDPEGTEYAWCVVFLSWCADQSGIGRDVIPCTAGVYSMREFYQDQGRYASQTAHTPQIGDIAFFRQSHVGLVVAVDDAQILVVEGNYSDGVVLNTYPRSTNKITGYASPSY